MLPSPEKHNADLSQPDRGGPRFFPDLQPIIDQVLATCGLGRMLHVGCGTGQLVRKLLDQGIDACGIDGSSTNIVEANKLAPGHYQAGSLPELPYERESFDTIISTNGLQDIAEVDIPSALSELYRVTKRFLCIRLTSTDRGESRSPLAARNRTWWEAHLFAAGFRRHPLLFIAVGFQSLDTNAGPITQLFEKIPLPAWQEYPLAALQTEHNLPMDALREAGPRSDAAIARYSLAKDYIRPNDVVLDLACGIGYGSAILWDGSEATKVIGLDSNLSAVEYAQANFCPQRTTLEYHQGDVGKLLAFSDESMDVVVSFETVGNLKEVHRLLKPGGRLICSVSNAQFALSKLMALVGEHLLVEQIFAQLTPDNGHRFVEVTASAHPPDPEAERWLLVAMKDPVAGHKENYVETAFPTGLRQELNITAFARDYRNPWLVRSMVTIGQRCRSAVLLRDIARRVLESAPFSSADAGAALCVSGYLQLESQTPDPRERERLIDQLRRYANSAGKTAHAARWRISNQYLLAKLLLSGGQVDQAREEFWKCAQMDCLGFSPLLATKTVDAAFWTGWLALSQQRAGEARTAWQHGIREARRALGGEWQEVVGNSDRPLLFGLREATVVLDAATRCANGLYALEHWSQRPGYCATMTLYSLSSELKRQQAIIADGRNWIESLNEGKAWLEQQNAELKGWVQELEHARDWLEKQRSAWQLTAQEGEKIAEEQRQAAQRLEQQNAELKGWVEELEQARNWLEKQRSARQLTAQEREKIAGEQRGWSQRLEQAKAWLEQQATNWRQTAEKRETIIEEQRAWVRKLEEGNAWHEQERNRWQQLAEERGKTIQQHASELESYKRQVLADKEAAVQQHRATAQALEQAKAELRQHLSASRAAIEKLEDTQRKHSKAIEQVEGALTDSRKSIAEKDTAIQENLATIRSGEQAREELRQQLGASRAAIEELEDAQRKQAKAIEQLGGSVAKLEQQRNDLLAKIQRRDTHLGSLEKRFWYRALVRLKLLPPPFTRDDKSE